MADELISNKLLYEAAGEAARLPSKINNQPKIIEFVDHFRDLVDKNDDASLITAIQRQDLTQVDLSGLITLMRHYCGEDKLQSFSDVFIKKARQLRTYRKIRDEFLALDLSPFHDHESWLIKDETYSPGRFAPYLKNTQVAERRERLEYKARLENFQNNLKQLKMGPEQAEEMILNKFRLILTSYHNDDPEDHSDLLEDEITDITKILDHCYRHTRLIDNIYYKCTRMHMHEQDKVIQVEEVEHYLADYIRDARPDLYSDSPVIDILKGMVTPLNAGRKAHSQRNKPFVFMDAESKRYLRDVRKSQFNPLLPIWN